MKFFVTFLSISVFFAFEQAQASKEEQADTMRQEDMDLIKDFISSLNNDDVLKGHQIKLKSIECPKTNDSIQSIKNGFLTRNFLENMRIFLNMNYDYEEGDGYVFDTPGSTFQLTIWNPFKGHTCTQFSGNLSENIIDKLREANIKTIKGQVKDTKTVVFQSKDSVQENADGVSLTLKQWISTYHAKNQFSLGDDWYFVKVTFQPGCKMCEEGQD